MAINLTDKANAKAKDEIKYEVIEECGTLDKK